MPNVNESPEIHELIYELESFFAAFGMKRNVGRVWATIYLSTEPMTQAEIIKHTELSSGFVSTAIRDLQRWGAVRVISRSGRRAAAYEAETRLLRIVSTILQKRELSAVRAMREAAERARAIHSDNDEMDQRLEALEQTAQLYEVLSGLINRLSVLPPKAVPAAMRWINHARRDRQFFTRRPTQPSA